MRGVQFAGIGAGCRVFHRSGRNESSWLTGVAAIRVSTSRRYANGSTLCRWQVAMRLKRTAAVFPPLSEPQKSQFFRPRVAATPVSQLDPFLPDQWRAHQPATIPAN